MNKYLPILALAALLVGCDPPAVKMNSDIQIGIVDGKVLHRVTTSSGEGSTHYIYYFPSDRSQPISNNMRIGKVGTVIVLIDGQPVSTNRITLEQQ